MNKLLKSKILGHHESDSGLSITLTDTGDVPVIPSEDIYCELFPDEGKPEQLPPPRRRGHTIGNGQVSRANKRENAIFEAIKNARRRREERRAIPTVFRYSGACLPFGSAARVFICGTMTNWKCLEMTRPPGEHDYVRIFDCFEGKVVFKFNVNGEWRHDVKQQTIKQPIENSNNSKEWNVLYVSKSDNDVFDALACDSFALRGRREESGKTTDYDRENDDDAWTQEKPPESLIKSSKGPPLLPPHLLQVLLNKTTEEFKDPTLLPEPSHVTLDHLYAQSIRENVLVISTTHRYRKKCVTYLYYKPV